MRAANILACFIFIISGLIRFSYLVTEYFSFFLLAQNFFLLFFIALLAASEGAFGLSTSVLVRTYFNLLDGFMGRGMWMCFLASMLFEFTQRGEVNFGGTALIIGFFNMMLGFDEPKKDFPSDPFERMEHESDNVISDIEKDKRRRGKDSEDDDSS